MYSISEQAICAKNLECAAVIRRAALKNACMSRLFRNAIMIVAYSDVQQNELLRAVMLPMFRTKLDVNQPSFSKNRMLGSRKTYVTIKEVSAYSSKSCGRC